MFWREGASVDQSSEEVWEWQPLKHHKKGLNTFQLELQWSLGAVIGVLEVTLGTFSELRETLLILFHVAGTILQEAALEIEHLTPGDTPPLATGLPTPSL